MRTSGVAGGAQYAPHTIQTESSGQSCVSLADAGQFVEFTAVGSANTLVVRFSLPDSPKGGGTESSLTLLVNGKPTRALAISSRNALLYGDYPFSNDPGQGKPRNFYDELRVKDLSIAEGDVVRIEKTSDDGLPCAIDLVDLEQAPASLKAPTESLNVLDFGASGTGQTDDTKALIDCIAAAKAQARIVWVPAGTYKLSGDIILPSFVSIQGAGMWHTTFVGDQDLYKEAGHRVRFKMAGDHIHLADFAIVGALDYRKDSEPNDGIIGAGCQDSTISRIWIEHTKVGVWIYNGINLTIQGCRFRDTLADGVNLCVGTKNNLIENCTARGTGDDCFAFWPAATDQGYVDKRVVSGGNVIRRCTGQLTFLANGGAIYGGANNRIEDCLFTDIGTGCGILISSTFPTFDESLGIDNNFSGATVVRNCRLVRCGGNDHTWAWRGSFQICMDRRSISGLDISQVEILDSISDGLTIVGPGSSHGQGTLSDSCLKNVVISNAGIGASGRHALLVRNDAQGTLTLVDCQIADIENDSKDFKIAHK